MPNDPGQIGTGSLGSQSGSTGTSGTPVTKINAAVKSEGLAALAKTFESILKSTTGILKNVRALNSEGRTGGSAWSRLIGAAGQFGGASGNNTMGSWMSSLPPSMQTVGGYQAGMNVAAQQRQQGRAPGTNTLNLPPMVQTPGYQPPQPSGGGNSMPWMSSIGGAISGGVSRAASAVPGAIVAAAPFTNMLSNRISQQISEGAPISSQSMLLSSMYTGAPYGQIERNRLSDLGRFGGSRQDASAAQGMALRYGGTMMQTSQYLQGVGNTVQAMGGTMSAPQVVQATGSFLDPVVLRRQISSGMQAARINGQVRNPMEVSQDYIKNFEQKFNAGKKLNEYDFINLGTPGAGLRIRFQKLYQLDDTALDMIMVAGMQTVRAGGSLNYNSSGALAAAGMTGERLGLATASLTTTQGVRNANFLANTEGGMVNRLQTEETVQRALGGLEDATGSLIEEFASLDRVIKGITTGLMVMGGMSMFGGGGGGGGGLMSKLGFGGFAAGAGGGPGTGVPANGTPAAAAAGAAPAAGRGAAMAGKTMTAAAGIGFGVGAITTAVNAQDWGDMFSATAQGAASGAMIGSLFGGVGAPVGAAVGGVLAFGAAGASWLADRNAAKHEEEVTASTRVSANMTDAEILAEMSTRRREMMDRGVGGTPYTEGEERNLDVGLLEWTKVRAPNSDPKASGMLDQFQRRRSALIAQWMQAESSHPSFSEFINSVIMESNGGETPDNEEIDAKMLEWGNLATEFSKFSTETSVDDDEYIDQGEKLIELTKQLRGPQSPGEWTDSDEMKALYTEYFEQLQHPMLYRPVYSDHALDIIGEYSYSPTQLAQARPSESGDAVFATLGDGPRGDSTHGGLTPTIPFDFGSISSMPMDPEPNDPNWNKMDKRMQQRLRIMFAASGGQVKWAKGGGWRSEETQRNMFLERYRPDPNGSIEWNGQRWRHVSGPAAAPPGRSYHEIGLAADLDGPGVGNGWLRKNARKFGLKEFSSVNDEPWHVQLLELPNGRSSYDASADTGGAGEMTTVAATESAPSGGGGGGGFGGSSGLGGATSAGLLGSGISSLSTLMGGGGGGGSAGFQGTGGSTTADQTAAVTWEGGVLSGPQIAQMAYNAGFRGENLVKIIGIARRESHWDPTVHNDNTGTGDDSYGLVQINMLGEMGPSRRAQFGIESNAELLDPNTNLRAAYQMSGGTNFYHWLEYRPGLELSAENVTAARNAVAQAGLGDAVFDSGHGLSPVGMSSTQVVASGDSGRSSGSRGINVNVTIQSTGNYAYDAKKLAQAARPAFEAEYAEVSAKRNT